MSGKKKKKLAPDALDKVAGGTQLNLPTPVSYDEYERQQALGGVTPGSSTSSTQAPLTYAQYEKQEWVKHNYALVLAGKGDAAFIKDYIDPVTKKLKS